MGWIGDLGSQVLGGIVDYQLARFNQPPQIQPVQYLQNPGADAAPVDWSPTGGFLNLFGDDDGAKTSTSEVIIDNATGQCISVKKKKKRRRRKRLATTSDIKDLAALKSVLGGGKALDNWINTRGQNR